MKNEIFINFEKEIFEGNILDIGFENYGIVYTLCKKYDDKINIEYYNGKREENLIDKNYYDNAVVMFGFNYLATLKNKKQFIKKLHSYLKGNAYINIWEMDKPKFKSFRGLMKVALPETKVLEIKLNSYNIFNDLSKKTLISLLEPYFDIIDLKTSNNIYYLKARKK